MEKETQVSFWARSLLRWLSKSHIKRGDQVEILIAALTELNVVVVYYDDTVARRADPELNPDTPFPQ